MTRELINGLQLWRFRNLKEHMEVNHFVSERKSNGNETEFTLSLSSTPDKSLVREHRRKLAAAMEISESALFFPSQVHGVRIVKVNEATQKEDLAEADALITDEKRLCVAVMSADCVTILLYDKRNKAVGAIHSGWRGTVARILEKTLVRMNTEYGTEGSDIIAAIGPSVCQDSYEVGEEVVQEVEKAFGSDNGLMIAQPSNKAKLDLWKANETQLLQFGVPKLNIEVSDLCTIKNNHHFFSARKGDSGRFAAGIMLT